MSKHEWTIVVEVDDGELAQHDAEKAPPPPDVDEWDPSDLIAANALGIVELREAEFTGYTCIEEGTS